MTAPKHLWTDNWEEESADAAAQRSGHLVYPEPEPEVVETPVARPRVRRRRRLPRTAIVVALLALLVVGAAVAGRALDHSSRPRTSSSQTAWLGAEVQGWPAGGALVASVTPGSPAQFAGLRPGDIITQVEGRPVGAAVNVTEAVGALRPGDQLALEIHRGSSTYSMAVKLAARKSGIAYP
jgi:S1-C subfamily serine protease